MKAPGGTSTRPTTDRVREAVFDALSARFSNDFSSERVLDAFAGSGALGIEALSRGAAQATFVEKSRRAGELLKTNLAGFGATQRATVVTGDVLSLAGRMPGGPFTLILLDPPYTLDAAVVEGFLRVAAEAGEVAPGAWVTWEHATGQPARWPVGYEMDAVKRYGSTEIEFGRMRGDRTS